MNDATNKARAEKLTGDAIAILTELERIEMHPAWTCTVRAALWGLQTILPGIRRSESIAPTKTMAQFVAEIEAVALQGDESDESEEDEDEDGLDESEEDDAA